jgi:oxygen-dependent protoporphyrinogen oxidase
MPDGMRMMVPARWEPLVHSPLLSWQGKLAYLREPKRAAELKASALLLQGEDADESVAAFVIRHFGQEATRTLAGPLLAGVFGGDIEKLSVRAVMQPFVRMEAETGSLIEAVRAKTAQATTRPATFTSLKSGLQTLINRMAAAIPAKAIQLHTTVNSIRRTAASWQLTTSDNHAAAFDSLIIATPAHVTSALLHSLQHAAAEEIVTLLPAEASSAVVVALGFSPGKADRLRIPRGFGFLAPAGHQEPELLAATFVDQKFNHRAPKGGVLLRGFYGGASAEELGRRNDSFIVQRSLHQLSRLLGPLPAPDIAVVRRWPKSLPQYHVGHTVRIARVRKLLQQLSGLTLLGNAYHGVGLPDLIRDARTEANLCLSVRTSEATQ